MSPLLVQGLQPAAPSGHRCPCTQLPHIVFVWRLWCKYSNIGTFTLCYFQKTSYTRRNTFILYLILFYIVFTHTLDILGGIMTKL